jgi:hypothetical protein
MDRHRDTGHSADLAGLVLRTTAGGLQVCDKKCGVHISSLERRWHTDRRARLRVVRARLPDPDPVTIVSAEPL